MRRAEIAVLLFAVLLVGSGAGSGPVPAVGVVYPESIPGGHAREYFVAYQSGAAAMKAFWAAQGAPAALAQRPVDARVEVWRRMHEEFGALTPIRVLGAGADFVEVMARAEHGGSVSIRFECEADAAHGLVGLQVEDTPDAAGPPAASAPPETGPPPTDPQIVASLESELDSLARAGTFSGAVRLDKGDRTLFERAYGMASRAGNEPNRPDTRFNLGSINKIFTHVAIEQLAQQGKLKLSDTIDRYLPDYPKESARRITIRMLLDHRSGVPDVLQNPELWKDAARVRTLADWYALIRERPLRFEPGARQEYSNGGYVLLGAIIARVSAEDYYDYIRAHLYVPAGMTRTDHFASDERIEGRAIGYTRRAEEGEEAVKPAADGWASNEHGRVGRGSPAGGGYSTVGDLVRFANALRAGKLLDAAHTREMFGEQFSLGIAGGSPGVNGLFLVNGPYTFVVLANLDPPAAERFASTVGRMVRRATGPPQGEGPLKKVGGTP